MKKLLTWLVLLCGTPLIAQLATASIGTAPSATVPSTFMGFAIEWGSAETVMGQASTGTDTIYRQLEANLTTPGSTHLLNRIGGNSTDQQLTSEVVQPFVELNSYNGDTFTLGVNLACNSLTSAETQAAGYYTALGSALVAIEVGNEPDSYVAGNTYSVCSGATLGWNPWTPAQYYAALASWMSGIRGVTAATLNFEGPSFAVYNGINTVTGFQPSKPGVQTSSFRNGLSIFSQHYYAGTGGALATDYLMSSAAYYAPGRLAPDIRNAHSLGLKYRIDEFNSVAGGGQSGVSNTHQAALWFLTNALNLAAEGVDGVNVEGNWINPAGTGGNYYSPAYISESGSGPVSFTLQAVYPIYYGMYAFQVATGGTNSNVYPVSVTAGTGSLVNGWATTNAAGVQRLVLVNLDETNSGNVLVANAASSASVCYLSNSASPAWTGTATTESFAGQTFNGSTTGALTGTASYTSLTPSSGTFTIPLAVAQAAIVRFGVSSGC